jgi:energy-coupling factor transporter transmembrane protein EcfT
MCSENCARSAQPQWPSAITWYLHKDKWRHRLRSMVVFVVLLLLLLLTTTTTTIIIMIIIILLLLKIIIISSPEGLLPQ